MTGLEAIHLSLSGIEKHLCDAAEAIAAQADAQEGMAVKQDEILVGIERLESLMSTLTSKVAQLHDKQDDYDRRLGAFITDQSKQNSSVRLVDKRLRELEDKLSG
jgi:hypothetical protein